MYDENFQVYGVRKVWRQLLREGFDVARCTVARLMRKMGLSGVIRGKSVKTTVPDRSAPCPLDHVNRQFQASRPNLLWVSDFTYVATSWQSHASQWTTGFVYVAFVIDAFARRIVGWRASKSAHAGFVLVVPEARLDAWRRAFSTMRWSRPCTIAVPSAAASSTTLIAACNTSRSNTPSDWPRPVSCRRSAASAIAITMRSCRRRVFDTTRDDQRALQSRGHLAAWSLALAGCRRVCDARMGRLVQQPPASGAHRQQAACRGRSHLLRGPGGARETRRLTQANEPPENPGRFKFVKGCHV